MLQPAPRSSKGMAHTTRLNMRRHRDDQSGIADSAGGDRTPATAVRVEGAGPLVVLVPGMDGTGRLFYRQVPLLAKSYRVATVALRDAAAHMETLVAELAETIHALTPNGEPAIVVGESFGGALAMSLAVQRPECVRALVVINSFARFLPQWRLRLAAVGARMIPWGSMAIIRRLTAFRMHSRYTHRAELERFLAETRATTKEGYLNRLRILRDYDMRPHLGKLAMPVLFLAAELDHLVPAVEQAGYMEARVPDAEMRVLEGEGHICLIAPNVDLSEILGSWEARRAALAATG